MNHPDVVITGLGPVTSLGVGVEGLWAGLHQPGGNVRLRPLTVDLGKNVDLPLADMLGIDQAPFERHHEFLAEQNCAGFRDLAYSLSAIELALADARLQFDRSDNRIGMIQAYEAPGVERTAARLFELFSTPPTAGPPPVYDLLAPAFYNMQAFVYVHVVAKAFGLRGLCTSVHNACSSGAFAVEVAAQHIRSGQADAMIIVGGEAFETAVRLEWFRRLNLYAEDPRAMRPFSRQSIGFFVGEGASAMVLESVEAAARRGARPYARYAGGAFAHQAWKQTIPDVRAGRLAGVIAAACRHTGIAPGEIDLIVPHGAGTQLSDGYEAGCIQQAFAGCAVPPGAVVKHAVGHMLAGSAIIDTVVALLMLRNQALPAGCGLPEDDLLHDRRANGTKRESLGTLLKTSTGFTGHDAALIFQRV